MRMAQVAPFLLRLTHDHYLLNHMLFGAAMGYKSG